MHVFREGDSSKLKEFLSRATAVIGHNIIDFDYNVLKNLAGVTLNENCIIDTLVVSRLLNTNIEGGHSLEAIGERLGYPKLPFSDWSKYTQEMENYCIRDVEVTYKYYKSIEPYLFSAKWKQALRLEHNIAFICSEMSRNGFAFNFEKAKEIYAEVVSKLQTLDVELSTAFPAKSKLIREITPRATKKGTLHSGDFRWLQSPDLTPYQAGVPFSRFEWVPFNPSSPKQIVERLNEAGWSPYEKTKGHIQAERDGDSERLEHYRQYGWKVSPNNLATLPPTAPKAARTLVERLTLDSRRSTFEEWFNAYNPYSKRIHGRFHHIGAWTHRMSHSGPNMANIPSGNHLFSKEMRSLWTVPEGSWLVGVDADSIQLRILAHYMNDPKFTEALINGRKEDGTDAHTLNQRALGDVCRTRDDAKTFIYAWLLGAGDLKISQILGCTTREARDAKENFISAYPALKFLKEYTIPKDASMGYFSGLDGRAVLCDSEHLMLAGYLQNGEAIIMKTANIIWYNKLKKEGYNFKQVNFVHDEWQVEIKGTKEEAEKASLIIADSIREAGELLKMKCPLKGNAAIGTNWYETH